MELRSLGIHDGSFHADEVTASSLLILFGQIDREKIYRTRDPKRLAQCEFVCDVGGTYDPKKKRFDHHQASYQGPLSSAGMVLLDLKERKLIDPALYQMFNESLVKGVDAHDNGVVKLERGVTSFSQVVSNFSPIRYDAPHEEMEKGFQRALDFVLGHLTRLKERYEYTLGCKAQVKQAMEEKKEVLLFDESIPWLDSFFDLGGRDHPAQFIIMPSGGHWKLRGIPPSLEDRMRVRLPLPEEWKGLQGEEFKKVCGIPGAIFCHKGLFISIWETKEDALEALKKVMHGKKRNGF